MAKHSISQNPHPLEATLARRVREARLLAGWSQTRLADRLGLTFQQVQKYERATNRISASVLHDIAAALQRPIMWFYVDDDSLLPRSEAHTGAVIARQRQALELLRGFLSLPPATQARLYDLVAELAKSAAGATGKDQS